MKNLLPPILMCSMLVGCHAIVHIDKRPNSVQPIVNSNNITQDWIIVDQGYEVTYSKWGFNTEVQSIRAEISTNKSVSFQLGGLSSTIPTNNLTLRMDDIIDMVQYMREGEKEK